MSQLMPVSLLRFAGERAAASVVPPALRQERIRVVPRLVAKLVAFVRWLLASERLPAGPADDAAPDLHTNGPGFTRWLLRGDTLRQDDSRKTRWKPSGFVAWVLARDALRTDVTGTTQPVMHASHFWSSVLRREELPLIDRASDKPPVRTAFFTRLFASETCPEHSGGAIERSDGWFRRLLAPEQCPVEPSQAAPKRRGFTKWLLEGEECPTDSTPAPVRRPGFWRNVFAPEKL